MTVPDRWMLQRMSKLTFNLKRSEDSALDASAPGELQLECLANSLVQLLETAKRDLDHDRDAARVSLAKASSILQLEIDRRSGGNSSRTGGLAGWQIARVQDFIDENLHGTINTRDLSAVARRSPAHFARSFKRTFGESPHAYVMRRRLEKACHLMMTSSDSLSQIALSVGFSDQSHLCKRFKQAFGESPSNWRREREIVGSLAMGNRWPAEIPDRQQTREKLDESRSSPQPVSSSTDAPEPHTYRCKRRRRALARSSHSRKNFDQQSPITTPRRAVCAVGSQRTGIAHRGHAQE
jgi:AraC family transcriptional regulator